MVDRDRERRGHRPGGVLGTVHVDRPGRAQKCAGHEEQVAALFGGECFKGEPRRGDSHVHRLSEQGAERGGHGCVHGRAVTQAFEGDGAVGGLAEDAQVRVRLVADHRGGVLGTLESRLYRGVVGDAFSTGAEAGGDGEGERAEEPHALHAAPTEHALDVVVESDEAQAVQLVLEVRTTQQGEAIVVQAASNIGAVKEVGLALKLDDEVVEQERVAADLVVDLGDLLRREAREGSSKQRGKAVDGLHGVEHAAKIPDARAEGLPRMAEIRRYADNARGVRLALAPGLLPVGDDDQQRPTLRGGAGEGAHEHTHGDRVGPLGVVKEPDDRNAGPNRKDLGEGANERLARVEACLVLLLGGGRGGSAAQIAFLGPEFGGGLKVVQRADDAEADEVGDGSGRRAGGGDFEFQAFGLGKEAVDVRGELGPVGEQSAARLHDVSFAGVVPANAPPEPGHGGALDRSGVIGHGGVDVERVCAGRKGVRPVPGPIVLALAQPAVELVGESGFAQAAVAEQHDQVRRARFGGFPAAHQRGKVVLPADVHFAPIGHGGILISRRPYVHIMLRDGGRRSGHLAAKGKALT